LACCLDLKDVERLEIVSVSSFRDESETSGPIVVRVSERRGFLRCSVVFDPSSRTLCLARVFERMPDAQVPQDLKSRNRELFMSWEKTER
jgi:hypothetical protein